MTKKKKMVVIWHQPPLNLVGVISAHLTSTLCSMLRGLGAIPRLDYGLVANNANL